MKDFKNTLLSLIDNGASQAKNFIEGFNDLVDSFDMSTQLDYFNEKKNELIKRGNELFGDFADLLKQVKDNISDFSVTVPFDESIGEEISYKVVDGRLNVEVSYEDESTKKSNKTSVLLPSNCDIESISLTTNTTMKTATITIPKIVIEPTEEGTAPTKKPKKKIKKKNGKKTTQEETSSEETANHVSSKLVEKLRQNGNKYNQMLQRDASGRFVRRTPREKK